MVEAPGLAGGPAALGRRLGEEGLASVVVALPALLLVVWVAIQFALWGLAAHAAELAAADGGQAARAFGAEPGVGRATARGVLASMGSVIEAPVIRVTAGAASTVTVRVSGQVVPVLPGLPLRVSAVSTGPSQRFRASG
ncbi:MAG TPA: hypothetical protein VE152_13275 [Acidimicrobiales bacterium]|jgi:hypothetical protein|nr:hypothetical protein [Acidimicrobiales bacterium]